MHQNHNNILTGQTDRKRYQKATFIIACRWHNKKIKQRNHKNDINIICIQENLVSIRVKSEKETKRIVETKHGKSVAFSEMANKLNGPHFTELLQFTFNIYLVKKLGLIDGRKYDFMNWLF